VTSAAMVGTIIAMPLTVFDIKGVPVIVVSASRAAVVGGGKQACCPH